MVSTSPGEIEPLLPKTNNGDAEHASQHGSVDSFSNDDTVAKDDFDSDSDEDDDDEEAVKVKRAQRLKETGGWLGYLKDFGVFLPYLNPRHDPKVLLSMLVCLACLAGQRVLNIMVPNQLGIVADKVFNGKPPVRDLFIWLGLNILHNNSGLGLLLNLAIIPVKQFAERGVTNAAFKHVLSLSMDFHSERDSAEVMKALEQGGSLAKLLQTAVRDFIPTVVDLIVAFGILYWKFDVYTSLVMVFAFSSYLALEVFTSRWRVEPRRRFAKTERREAKVMHQAIQGWATVSYFNMFGFERRRFQEAVDAKLHADRRWTVIDNVLEGAVDLIIPCTFFTIAGMAIWNISHGRGKPGDFVFLVQYWDYLIWPLSYLSHDYREIMSNLIDAERLLDLLRTQPSVSDRPEARDLGPVEGHVAFEKVAFAYNDRNTTIRDLDIVARPGQTIALVGATGAGKSTVTKLLLRFYDVTSGRITLDRQDVRDVTLSSLRDAIGVVPQDPLLFNTTILENLRYAKPTASFPDIVAACRAAAIHDRILSFPDGYRTQVGEQGVKLSGGEVQRLAVARAFLKDPAVLILDEATSAIDTQTESNIQRALDAFQNTRQRTTFIIAHRLSTIVGADQILVFEEGRVVERGTHAELVAREGVYHGLWSRQTSISSEEEERA